MVVDSSGECWLSFLCPGLFSLPCMKFSSCLWNGEIRTLFFKRQLKFICVPVIQQMGHSDKTNQLQPLLPVTLAEWGICLSSLKILLQNLKIIQIPFCWDEREVTTVCSIYQVAHFISCWGDHISTITDMAASCLSDVQILLGWYILFHYWSFLRSGDCSHYRIISQNSIWHENKFQQEWKPLWKLLL